MKVYQICFSPTGGVQKAADQLSAALGAPVEKIDLTDRQLDFSSFSFDRDALAVLAVPSYGGRVPALAAARIAALRADGTPAVLLCVYGNRAFEDTLVELEDLADAAGFCPVAGVAAIAEHSIARQFASGRPDAQDCTKLREDAAQILAKLASKDNAAPALPGNRPYKPLGSGVMVPQAGDGCVRCGLCAARCPAGAIPAEDPSSTDATRCIGCMRCISVCPQGARALAPGMLERVGGMLAKVCSARREGELFL